MTWRRVRQRVISIREGMAWSILWITAGVVIASPQISTRVANFFGVGRGSDFVVYGSVILLFVLVFKIFILLESLERKLTEMIRRDALKNLPEKKD